MHILQVGVAYLTYTLYANIHKRTSYIATIQSTMQTAKKNKTMLNFAAVKELVEQHVDSYRCSRASLTQALTIRHPLLELQALLG